MSKKLKGLKKYNNFTQELSSLNFYHSRCLRQYLLSSFAIILSLTFFLTPSWAGPWLTGPLIAPAGLVMPNGHTNLETYGFYTDNRGGFDRNYHLRNTGRSDGANVMPIFSHGVAPDVDISYVASYIINHSQRFTSQEIGDVVAILGYQALKQQDYKWRPSLRVVLVENIPTGRFDALNETFNGQDVTGLGGYRTGFGLNFEHLLTISEPYYLRTRFSITYFIPHPISIRGVSAFGGTPTTEGTIFPGQLISFDLAGELTLTKNWVAVMEAVYFNGGISTFRGYVGQSTTNTPASVGRGATNQFSVMPAIEYNFSQRVGIIAGLWIPVTGRLVPNFINYMAALNIYW
ncbi:MAG: hypothetical protein H2069_00300 [Legionella sp.]|nr:hypothetical protein [Legionella sp.]